jgi:hypothetical protein
MRKLPPEQLLANRRATARRYRQTCKKKCCAQQAVKRAILRGRLVRQPCEVCGATPGHAHHDDYDNRFDVRWLCMLHHARWHAENGEGANANTPILSKKRCQYRGVSCYGRSFRAEIFSGGMRRQKIFSTAVDAALQYDAWARELHGDRAQLNFEPRKVA